LVAQIVSFLVGAQKSGMADYLAAVAAWKKAHKTGNYDPKVDTEGYTRLDALGRIGNQIFWTQERIANPDCTDLEMNYALYDAPVNFPPIWDSPWFDWVQYNGSLMQPMFRNFSEALGAGALVNIGSDPERQLHSTVLIENIYRLEQMLAGPEPFPDKAYRGLRSPKWPEHVLGEIDRDVADEGRDLYVARCQHCHLPAPDTEEFWSEKYWKNDVEKGVPSKYRYLKLPRILIAIVGTDPAQARNLASRKIRLPEILRSPSDTSDVVEYGIALSRIGKAINEAYDEAGYSSAQREDLNGFRNLGPEAGLVYRPRPLNGMWATPPFLHNSSVPTLYDLLSPLSERPTEFYLGSQEFDPKKIGFDQTAGEGDLYLLDTTIDGNHNTGHEFVGDGKGPGVIGKGLTENERWALIEYIKTL